MLRRVVLAGVSACVLGVPLCFSQMANAQTSAVSNGSCPYWIDAATGERVPTITIPATTGVLDYQNYRDSTDRNHISSTQRGKTFVRQPDGSWIDSATGEQVPTISVPATTGVLDYQNYRDSADRNHISSTQRGKTFVLIPCPPHQTASSTGLYLGGELVKNSGWVRSTERLAATGVVTNQFTDTADPLGGGIIVGYKLTPWANNVVVSPFASFDFLHAPVNHTFTGGSYLGTTANFMGTGGVKIGPQLDMSLWLYGIAGVSVLNETLNINFIPVASTRSAWVAGATLGLGVAWQPSFLKGFGRPVSLFLEYQHTWWQDATFNAPAASQAFNYTFARQDDVVKFGFIVSLAAPTPPPPTRGLITK